MIHFLILWTFDMNSLLCENYFVVDYILTTIAFEVLSKSGKRFFMLPILSIVSTQKTQLHGKLIIPRFSLSRLIFKLIIGRYSIILNFLSILLIRSSIQFLCLVSFMFFIKFIELYSY